MALLPPLSGVIRVTSAYGENRPLPPNPHRGIDLGLQAISVYRQPVYAPAAGRIAAIWTTSKESQRSPGDFDGWPYGNAVAMHDESGTLWRFLHFDEPPPSTVGQMVAASDILGLAGQSGNSNGPHVHIDAAPNGQIDSATFRVSGARVDPLMLYADSVAAVAGLDPAIFRKQIQAESSWNPLVADRDVPTPEGQTRTVSGIAQIIADYHPTMRGRTRDPYASLRYAANLMADHLRRRDGNYTEALADYNTGPYSSGDFREEGYAYARRILSGRDLVRDVAPAMTTVVAVAVADTERVEQVGRERPYKRRVRLEVGLDVRRRVVIEELRVAFEIPRQATASPSPANVKIYNLPARHAAQIRQGDAMRFSAGYGDAIGLLHEGEILEVEHERADLDRVTTINLGNPQATTLTNALFGKSYASALPLENVVADIVASMGFSLGPTRAIPAGVVVENYVYHGKAVDALTDLLRPRGVRWWVQNEEVLFTSLGHVLTSPDLLINQRTGLIGTPTRAEGSNTDGGRVKVLLDPNIRIAQPFRLESEFLSGRYKVATLIHRGDNWADEFVTEIEALAL